MGVGRMHGVDKMDTEATNSQERKTGNLEVGGLRGVEECVNRGRKDHGFGWVK